MASLDMPKEAVGSLPRPNDIRMPWEFQEVLEQCKSKCIVYESYKICCVTWNVKRKVCYTNNPLEQWLAATTDPSDIYAIALQEMSNVCNINQKNAMWNTKLLDTLNCCGEYEILGTVDLVDIWLTIFIRKPVRPHVTGCATKKTYCRLINAFKICGGIAVSFTLNEDSLCFVNSQFDNGYMDDKGNEKEMEFLTYIGEHEQIFWLGDWKYGNSFQGYREGDLSFKQPLQNDAAKPGVSVCCDRVLRKGSQIELLAYNCVTEVRQSDHKPVYALFDVKVKTRHEEKYKIEVDRIFELVDKKVNECKPRIVVDKSELEFGVVRFNEMHMQYLNVSNSCPMTVQFKFSGKPGSPNAICEKWLRVDPIAGTLLPGSVMGIRVYVQIDANSVRGLLRKMRTTTGKVDLDILVLHVENGPDVFITVTGEYKPSCFGLSMESLCRTERPLSEYTQTEVKELLCSESLDYRCQIPEEFFMLWKYLKGQAITEAFSNLLYKDTMSVEFDEIRDWLDSWSTHEFPGTPNAAAKALLLFLDLPEEPLLHPYVEELLRTNTTCDAIVIISKLQEPRKMIFWELCVLLKVGIERHYYDIDDAALTFGRILLRKTTPEADSKRDTLCHDFMYRFLKIDPKFTAHYKKRERHGFELL